MKSPEQWAMRPARVDIPVDLAPHFVGVALTSDLVEDLEHPKGNIAAGGELLIRDGEHASRLGIEGQRRKRRDRPKFIGPRL
jgi:hypothetical protein